MMVMSFHSGMVEALASKTIVWEQEKGIEFLYDGVCLLYKFSVDKLFILSSLTICNSLFFGCLDPSFVHA